MYAAINNARLYYEEAGSGEAIIFVHGFSLDHRLWQPLIPLLTADYRPICYDLRGFGRSDLPTDRPYSHRHDLAALLEYLNISAAHLVGLSMGTITTLEAALEYPDCVKSLTLVSPSALEGFTFPEPLQALFRRLRELASQDLKAAKQAWLEAGWFEYSRRNPAAWALLKSQVEGYSGWHWLNPDSGQQPLEGLKGRVGEIGARALVLVGEHDLQYNHEIASFLGRSLPGAAGHTVIPASGHFPNLENPLLFNETLMRFWRQQY